MVHGSAVVTSQPLELEWGLEPEGLPSPPSSPGPGSHVLRDKLIEE